MELRPIRKNAAAHVAERSAELALETDARICHLSVFFRRRLAVTR